MDQRIFVPALVAGAVCFVVGLIAGVVLTTPNRTKEAQRIRAVEIEADTKVATATEQVERLKTENAELEKQIKNALAEIRRANIAIQETHKKIDTIERGAKTASHAAIEQKTEKEEKIKSTRIREQQIIAQEKIIRDMMASRAIHSIDVENNQVRIDPLIWAGLTLEQKQTTVMIFSKYFDAKGSTGRVTVLSNRNDNKLATYGSWGGLKILQ